MTPVRPRVIVRADASVATGAGHVMRCLTLARALRSRAFEVSFVSRGHEGNLNHIVSQAGFFVHELGPSAPNDEAEEVARTVGRPFEVLVVDHYALGAPFTRPFIERGVKVLVIDDLANRVHACHWLLDQNLVEGFERRYDGLVPPQASQMLGPRFALLREEFASQRVVRGGPVAKLLLSFGGTDPQDVTTRTIDALRTFVWAPWEADVVIGETNPHRAAVEDLCRLDARLRLHVQTSRMAALMGEADLMVGAGGSTHWERCALGLPAVVVSLAENQRPTTAYLASLGACVDLGDAATVTTERIAREVMALLGDRSRLAELALAAARLVPKEGGVSRVVEEISSKVCG